MRAFFQKKVALSRSKKRVCKVQGGLYKEAIVKDMKEKHKAREATDSVEVLTMVADFLGSRRAAAGNSVTISARWRRLSDGGLLDLGRRGKLLSKWQGDIGRRIRGMLAGLVWCSWGMTHSLRVTHLAKPERAKT